MMYFELSLGPFKHWNRGQHVIKKGLLKNREFRRNIARQKSPMRNIKKMKRIEILQVPKDWNSE